jgi:hypothetical protein
MEESRMKIGDDDEGGVVKGQRRAETKLEEGRKWQRILFIFTLWS